MGIMMSGRSAHLVGNWFQEDYLAWPRKGPDTPFPPFDERVITVSVPIDLITFSQDLHACIETDSQVSSFSGEP